MGVRAADANSAARSLFSRLDEVFDLLQVPGFSFLSTVELDFERGRFPEVLVQCLCDHEWNYRSSFFVRQIKQTSGQDAYCAGRLTFEATSGQTKRILSQEQGFRWGTAFRVWGLQVPMTRVSELIEASPENADVVDARAAWLASADLDALGLWVSPAVDEPARTRLAQLKKPT